jgi:hypothetical protein
MPGSAGILPALAIAEKGGRLSANSPNEKDCVQSAKMPLTAVGGWFRCDLQNEVRTDDVIILFLANARKREKRGAVGLAL